MNKKTSNYIEDYILNEAEEAFFELHQDDHIADLMLKKKFTAKEKVILQQIALRQKIAKKLPHFYAHKKIHYPASISTEQCSSEKTAAFKASLFTGNTFVDLCAGMGIDAYYLSQQFKEGILIEQNTDLAQSTAYNLTHCLEVKNIHVEAGMTAESFIAQNTRNLDLIYIDPSRRDTSGGRVYKLESCEPNVIALLPEMLTQSKKILIKTSPLLDIALTCKDLKYVSDVYCIAYEQECKELLFVVDKSYEGEYKIHALNLDKNTTLTFTSSQEQETQVRYSQPKKYLYEADVSLLKAGAFKIITTQYPVSKLHPHSHLYTSENEITDFPGRIFEVRQTIKAQKKELEKYIPSMKANLSIRNFPGTVDILRKKLKLQDGGDDYIFATTLEDEEKVILLCKKKLSD